MKKLILLLSILPVLAWGSKILSYNIYDRNDRADVMLTFDTPYEGVLRQTKQGDSIIIKLEGAFLDTPKIKSVNSKFLTKLTIAPMGEQIQIIAQVPSDISLQASKTSDSYGLRLRFMTSGKGAASQNSTEMAPAATASLLPTKGDNEFERSYYVVIAILVIGIAILFWLKHSINQKATQLHKQPKAPWLFQKNDASAENTPITPAMNSSHLPLDGGVHIRFQKPIDSTHTVAMLDYGSQSYLVLLGNNSVLLDKFQDNMPVMTQNDFESLLQSKHRELDGFFQLASSTDETFDTYKEKASGVY